MTQTRRSFLQTTAAGLAAGPLATLARSAEVPIGYSFVLLGDLHFDRLEHHDMAWVEADQPGDITQIRNYSRLTADVMPGLFAAVKRTIGELRETAAPPAFVLQVGDLVEGLCGSEELAIRQNREALEFIASADLGLPFLFTKGNHDVTGPGAVTAFDEVLLPFLQLQSRQFDQHAEATRANYTMTKGSSQFAFFDAYDQSSLEWLEAALARRTAERLFVTVHPPVVPYGARATWHLYSEDRQAAQREKLLQLLGRHEAIVLGGHLHKFSALTRTAGEGKFTQLAISSVLSAPDEAPRDALRGRASYTADQVQLEPRHSPETVDRRRAVYDVERRYVTSFEYANSAGFAVVTVDEGGVEANVYRGTGTQLLQSVRLAPPA